MADSLWNRTWSLFHAALEHAPEEREAFLEGECGGDEVLRREVAELLRNADATGVLDRSPVNTQAFRVEGDSLEGKKIGKYAIRARAGHGGMGVVYDAEQEEPVQRRVALKVMAPATHPDAAARFALERQALARMSHPHIASVFDAGVLDDGRPFLAMEYVEGVPIHEYCDRNALDIRQRLEIFIHVCQAIQHAHQKGIIHRDIKPSNVLITLVDGVAKPKVIDFGVAKATHPITGESLQTMHGLVVGTLEYMSPEQLDRGAGGDVDTRSDIYSLGVMLYELLCGLLPYDWDLLRKAGLDGLRQITRETEPPRPSARFRTLDAKAANEVAVARNATPNALARALAGDLDWILLKALDRDRTRRYASASEFADDVRRYLSYEPALAGPPSTTYRVAKFVRRHRAPVAVAAGVAALLVGFSIVTTMQSVEIRRALDRARIERAHAERVSSFLSDVFRASDPYAGRGSDVTAREVLDRSFQQISRDLQDDREVKASVLNVLGTTYGQLRQYDQGEKLIRESLALRRNLHGGDHLETAESLEALGHVQLRRAELPAAARTLEEAVAMKKRLLPAADPRRAEGLFYLGAVRRMDGSLDVARANLLEALSLSRNSNDPRIRRIAANAADELGNVGIKRADFAEAERWYRQALEMRQKDNPDAPATADTRVRLGAVLTERGDAAAAEPHLRAALATLEKHLGPDHEKIAPAANNLAHAFQMQSKFDAAGPLFERALKIWRRIHGDKHPGVAKSLHNLGLVAHDQSRYDDAERIFKELLAIEEKRLRPGHADLAFPINSLARVRHDQGRLTEAEPLYRQALEIRRKALAPDHVLTADVMLWLGRLLVEKGVPRDADPLLREGLAIREKNYKAGDWRTAEAKSFLGACLAAQKRFADAEPLLVEGYETLVERRGREWRRTTQALERLVNMYDAMGKKEEAARYRQAKPS